MTEIEVWLGENAYNMHKLKVTTVKDINLVRKVLNLKEEELTIQIKEKTKNV